MVAWLGRFPNWTRSVSILLLLLLLHVVAIRTGQPLTWEDAVIFGITIGLSLRWPVILPRSGMRVVLLGGLFFQTMWEHGLLTTLALFSISFLVRLFYESKTKTHWSWGFFCRIHVAVFIGYGVFWLAGGRPENYPAWYPPTYLAAVLSAYAYWVVTAGRVPLLETTKPWSERLKKSYDYIVNTWWVPLAFMSTTYLVTLVKLIPVPLTIPLCVLLLWIQSRLGPAFTPFFQDWAVSRLLNEASARGDLRVSRQYRLMRTAQALGQATNLPVDELRTLTYAALLQGALPTNDDNLPRWLDCAPTPELTARLRRQNECLLEWIGKEPVLRPVSNLLQYRFASYDGTGYPAVHGESVPLGANVLSAANALVGLIDSGQVLGGTQEAAKWLADHAADRFHPRVRQAMRSIYLDDSAKATQGLPDTVRQLRGLVSGASGGASLSVVIRRILSQIRGQVPLAPELPREVQAALQMGTIFTANTDADKTAQVVAEAIGQLVDGRVLLGLIDRPGESLELRMVASYNVRHAKVIGRVVEFQSGVMIRSLMNQEPFQISDIRELQAPFTQELSQVEGLRSLLFVPLISRGKTIGLLGVGLTDYHWFTPREVGLIHLMAAQAAVALDNARLLAEEAQRLRRISELKQFTDTLVEHLSPAIMVLNPDCTLRMANRAARTLFGSRYPFTMGAELDSELMEIFPVAAALAGEPLEESDRHWGNLILEVQAMPLRDSDGQLLGAVCIARDVTRLREMEQHVRRVEKLAAIGELAAGAAHEIRNPLTSIRGFIQLLEQRQSGGDERDYCRIVLDEIDRIDEIIRDMLLLARPSDSQRVVVYLAELVDEIMRLPNLNLEKQGIRWVRDYRPDAPAVAVDPKLIRQLVLNLVLNATQAMPNGGKLTVAVRPGAPGEAVLEVRDTGTGIPPENVKRLFVPFFTTREGGTGLGLALCYSIVQAHQGRIDVSSKPAVGTTFTITLPVYSTAQKAEA